MFSFYHVYDNLRFEILHQNLRLTYNGGFSVNVEHTVDLKMG